MTVWTLLTMGMCPSCGDATEALFEWCDHCNAAPERGCGEATPEYRRRHSRAYPLRPSWTTGRIRVGVGRGRKDVTKTDRAYHGPRGGGI